jgi:pantoate kinase
MKMKAFCPGHITGFFEIYMSYDEEKSGSRGAGICISLGATSIVKIKGDGIDVEINRRGDGKVTEEALSMLTEKGVEAKIEFQLPQSQGFGMSAAGTLASALALSSLLSVPKEDAVRAAHIADVRCSTGLGDVVSSVHGGIEIREKPGLYGKIRRIEGGGEIVVSVLGSEIKTEDILRDERITDRISEVGKKCMKETLARPTIEDFFSLSRKFAEETGLMNEMVEGVVREASQYGMASMCMLGNSVFAMGDTKKIAKILSKYGMTYTCKIDEKGARIL